MDYTIRPLNNSDYTNYLHLINQFRTTTFTEEEYNRILKHIHSNSTIWVLEYKNELIGTITILYEYKFIRNIVKLAHLEDVCIDTRYRKKGLGTLLLKFAISEDKKKEVKTKHYKVVEKFIQNYITENGGKNHLMQIRNNGKTEWFHCSIALLDEAFEKAKKKFGGILALFEIEKMEKIRVKPYFIGSINLYDKPVREYEN
jgi:glucosamine-phosphate N-acetyltransferase